MFTATRDKILPTAIVGSYPRPQWYGENLRGRPFKVAMTDAIFREQYVDAVGAILRDQERAGLDILTDGDARFDTEVGGRSWFFYPLERMEGIAGHRDSSPGWSRRFDLRPGQILWEVQEAYQAPGGGGQAGTRTAGIRRGVADRPALERATGEVRLGQRPDPAEHALERGLRRRARDD